MAEVTGLAVGALGLIGLFSSCLDCLELIQIGRSFAKENAVLCTKYEVEKERFLIWGDAAGICNTDKPHQNSLDRKWISSVTDQILLTLKLLFEDTAKLQSRYGLRPIKSVDLPESGQDFLKTWHFQSFRRHFAAFQARIVRDQKQQSFIRKVRWAVTDQKKFLALVEDIRQLIDGLQEITPDLSNRRRQLVKDNMSVIGDLEDLKLVQEACSETNTDWEEAASLCINEYGYQQVNKWVDAIGSEEDRSCDWLSLVVKECDEGSLRILQALVRARLEGKTLPSRPSQADRQLVSDVQLNDSLKFLDQVKVCFESEPYGYNSFLDVMRDFKEEAIDIQNVIDRTAVLFYGHPELLDLFKRFLPYPK